MQTEELWQPKARQEEATEYVGRAREQWRLVLDACRDLYRLDWALGPEFDAADFGSVQPLRSKFRDALAVVDRAKAALDEVVD